MSLQIQNAVQQMVGSIMSVPAAIVGISHGIKESKEAKAKKALQEQRATERHEAAMQQMAANTEASMKRSSLYDEKIKAQKLKNKQMRLSAKEAAQRAKDYMNNMQDERRASMMEMDTNFGKVKDLPPAMQAKILEDNK